MLVSDLGDEGEGGTEGRVYILLVIFVDCLIFHNKSVVTGLKSSVLFFFSHPNGHV